MAFLSTILSFFGHITAEPVSFFTFLGLVMYQLVRDTGLYRTVCIQRYGHEDVNCLNLSGFSREIENHVQQETTLWIMAYSLAVLLPAMFSDILLGAWGDRRGRKTNMLLGITGTIVAVGPLIALLSYHKMPIYAVLPANVICGVMGSSAIVMVSSYAYLADSIKDHNLLTTRMAVLSVIISAGMISGSYLAGILLQHLSLTRTLCVVIGVLLVGFFYCIIRIEDKPPPSTVRGQDQVVKPVQQQEPHETDRLINCATTKNCCSEFLATFGYAKTLLKDVCRTYTQKRPRNHRAYMLIGVVCFHVMTLADFQGNVITLFVYRYPLDWSPSMLATWRASSGLVNLFGGIIGALLLKRVLKLRDTTLILLGMSCAAGQNVMLALSTKTWMVYLSSGLGMFSTIAQPTICSLTTRLVRTDEVGKAFAAFTLAAETALILSAVLLNSIYQASVTFYPGLVFFFVTGCVLLAMAPMVWTHVNYDEEAEDRWKRKRDENGSETEASGPENNHVSE